MGDHFRQLCGQHATLPEGGNLPQGVPAATTLHVPEVAPQEWPEGVSRSQTQKKNRGRFEQREVISLPVGEWLPKAFFWYGLQSAICVIRSTMRQRHGVENPVQEVHYYLSSLPAGDAAKLGGVIHQHWSIENGCHHLLDVTYHEDHCQVRDRTSAQNWTLVLEMSAKLIKEHPLKGTIRSKRKRAALSPSFRSDVIAPFFHNLHE